MTRRFWVLTIGTALCSGIVPACLGPWKSADPEVRTKLQPIVAGEAVTPYQQTPLPQPMPASGPGQPSLRAENFGQTTEVKPLPMPAPPDQAPAAPKTAVAAVDRSEVFASAKPADDPPLLAAFRCFLEKRPEQASEQLKDWDKSSQEVLIGLLAVTSRFADGVPKKTKSSEEAVGRLVEGLNGVLTALRPRTPLKIEKMCFCSRIKTFGVYDPLPDRIQLRPDDEVPIYVELRNFSSSERRLPSGEVHYVIRLASSYEIQDEQGKTVYKDTFLREGETADESRTLRNDFFDNYAFTVPKLKPGPYTLCIIIEDRGTEPSRTVTGTLDFYVLPGKVRGG